MNRPKSIELFERCYLGGWLVALVNTATNWSRVQRDPRVVEAANQIGTWYMPTVTALGLLLPLILWYFIARRGSVVAKWVMVVVTAIGVGSLALQMARGQFEIGLPGILGIVGVVLNVIAATMLFRPDARPWFGETPVTEVQP